MATPALSLRRNGSNAGPSHGQGKLQAQNIFNQPGSLYVLTASQWTKLGQGNLSLIYNPHNARELVFKLKTEDDVFIFQLKPKLKPKGGSSWVLKATNTKTNKEDILAVRFKSQQASDLFRQHVEWADKRAPKDGKNHSTTESTDSLNELNSPLQAHHAHNISISPKEMRRRMPKNPWDCPLCTFGNEGSKTKCAVCSTPRPLMRQSTHERVGSPQDATPMLPESLQVDHNHLGTIGSMFNAPASPAGSDNASFDFSNSTLPEKPTKETDIKSNQADFTRILTMIESNITDQDSAKLFTDLKKVAKRLLRPDMKFRCLDLNNPVVKQRLFAVEGVDAYLSYLGFVKDDDSNKLICPEDQPPQSVIIAAQETCKKFIEQANTKNETFERMRKFSIQEKRRQSGKPNTTTNNNRASSKINSNNNKRSNNQNNSNSNSNNKNNNKNNLRKDSNDHKSSDDEKGSDSDEKTNINKQNSITLGGGKDDAEIVTLRQFVWSVTHETSRDDKTQEVLLLCHHTFSTTLDLFKVLVDRFNNPDDHLTDEEQDQMTPAALARSHWNVQVKVCNMLRHWIKSFYEQDFSQKPEVADALLDFFDSMEDHSDVRVKQLLDKLKKTNEHQEKELDNRLRLEARSHRPGKDLSAMLGASKKFKLNDQDAEAIAEQITLMDFKIFKKIQKRECLGQAWKKKDGKERAPNILLMIEQFNRVSKFVQVLILMAPDIRKRCKVIKKCIKIAVHLKELRNFSSLCAFNSALVSSPIRRLQDSWNNVPAGTRRQFEEISEIFSLRNNWKVLRKMHREAHAPAILYTGLFLQDIVGIDEGNDNKLNGKVNFKKLLRLYEKIDTIWMYQQAGYAFKENLLIQKVILDDFVAQEQLDEDYLYRFSTDVKEKDRAKASSRVGLFGR